MRVESQLYPGNQQAFIHAYKNIMKTFYRYMVIDLNPQSNPKTQNSYMNFPRRISDYLFTISCPVVK